MKITEMDSKKQEVFFGPLIDPSFLEEPIEKQIPGLLSRASEMFDSQSSCLVFFNENDELQSFIAGCSLYTSTDLKRLLDKHSGFVFKT